MADELRVALNEVIANNTALDQVTAKLRALQAAGNLNAIVTIRVEATGVEQAIANINRVSKAAITAEEVAARRAKIYGGTRGGSSLPPGAPISQYVGGEDEEEAERALQRAVKERFLVAQGQVRDASEAARLVEYRARIAEIDPFREHGTSSAVTLAALQQFEQENAAREGLHRFDKSTPAYMEQAEREATYSAALKRRGDIFAGAPPQYPGGGDGGEGGGGEGFFGRFGRRIQGLGFYLGAAAILYPISSALFQAAENSTKLETSLLHIQGILGSQSLSDRIAIRREIVDVADRYALDITQVADAAEKFAQQGESIGKIGTDLQAAAIGAQALGVSIDRAEEIMLSIKNITGSDEQSGSIFDKIFAVRRGSPVTPETLIQGVEQLLPLVAQLHGAYSGLVSDVDLVLGAIATVSKETNAASSTSLRFVLGRLGNPQTVNRVEALSGVGFGTEESNGKQLRPLINILNDLATAYQRLEAAHDPKALQLLQELAGSRQTRDVAILLKNWGDVMQTTERAAYSLGDAVGQAGRQLDSIQNRIEKVKNNLTAFGESMIETGAFANVLRGALFLVNAIIEGLNGGALSAIKTIGLVTTSIIALTVTVRALRAVLVGTAGVEGLAGLLGLSGGAVATGGIVAGILAITLALGGLYELLKSHPSPLAINFLTPESLQGQGKEHIDAFQQLASSIGASQQQLYNALTTAAQISADKFRDATGAINTTRKAFVDDFLNQVIKLSPEAGKYIDNLLQGLTPSDAAAKKLDIAQNFIGQIAYLSNALGNAHINQIGTAGQSLINDIASEATKLTPILGGPRTITSYSALTGTAGLVPGAVTSSTSASPQDLFNESIKGLDNLSPAVKEVATIILNTAKNMGVLDGTLKELNSTAGQGKDIWEAYAQRLQQVLDSTTAGPILINKVADALKASFIQDPKTFAQSLLGTPDSASTGKGIEDIVNEWGIILRKALERLRQELPSDQNAAATKAIDDFLRRDKGVLAQFENFNRQLILTNDPLYKFIENMDLSLRTIDQNAIAARNLGDAYDEAGQKLNLFRQLNKQFTELPITAFKDYLNQLQTVNQLEVENSQLQGAANTTGALTPATLEALGITGIAPGDVTAAQQAISGQRDATSKRLNQAVARLQTASDAINTLENFDVSGLQTTLARLKTVPGANNAEFTRLQGFLGQFTQDQAKIKGLDPKSAEFRAVATSLVQNFINNIAQYILDGFRNARIDENAYQQRLLDITTRQNIGKTQIGSIQNIQKQLATNQLSAIGGADLSDRLDEIRQQQSIALAGAQLDFANTVQGINALRGVKGANPDALDTQERQANATLQEQIAKANILSIEQQILAIDKEITQNQVDYNNQVQTNATARLSGLREVLGDVTKLTKGKELQTILGGVGKQFYERGVDNLLSAFNPNKGFGIFQQIGQFLGGAGEPDPIVQAHAQGAEIVKNAIITGHATGAGFFGRSVPSGVGGLAITSSSVLPTEGGSSSLEDLLQHDTIPSTNGVATSLIEQAGNQAQALLDKQDRARALQGLGSTAGIDIGELLGARSVPGSNIKTPGPNAQAGSQFGSAVLSAVSAKALGSTLGIVAGPLGALAGGVIGGLVGGLFDHPKPNPIQAHLERIEANTKDQVNLLQNTNKLLEASGLNFNVSSSFRLPRYGVDTFIGGGGGARGGPGVVAAGTASVANSINVAVNIGNTSATAADIGKMVASAVADRLDSEYSTGGRYVSTRTRY